METVFAPKAPDAVGPYCHAIKHNNLLFTSGQIALDPETNKLIKGDVQDEALRVLQNLELILNAAGTSKDKVIKVTVFIADMDDFAKINQVYSDFFTPHTPARACVQVAKLPLDVKVEMEMVAAL
jgi:2-iminobutanoate/2-iminopropanoate deaminase